MSEIKWFVRDKRCSLASVNITFVKMHERKYMNIRLGNGLGNQYTDTRVQVGYDPGQNRLYFRKSNDGHKATMQGNSYVIRVPAFEGAGAFLGAHEWRYDKETGFNYVEVGK